MASPQCPAPTMNAVTFDKPVSSGQFTSTETLVGLVRTS